MADEERTEANPWTANQYKFLAWLALPSRHREPLLQQELAKELGVVEQTLCKWKKLPGFQQELERVIRENMKGPLNEIVGSFLDEARKGSFQHSVTYFQMIGWYTPTQKVDHTVKLFGEFDTEQV